MIALSLVATACGVGGPALAQTSADATKISVRTAEQLHAIRWDLDGNGVPVAAMASSASYHAAFPSLSCAPNCTGYVLDADVDLDASRWSRSSSTAGWQPIGTESDNFVANFDGQGRAIENLFINRPTSDHVGLFGYFGYKTDDNHTEADTPSIRNVGIEDADVTGRNQVGALVGLISTGTVATSYVRGGSVSGASEVGGLVGNVRDNSLVDTVIKASYAIVRVRGGSSVGGLVGRDSNDATAGSIMASYAAGRVTGMSMAGGLVGRSDHAVPARDSYWDTEASGQAASAGAGVIGTDTASLQMPTTYSGIYANWNIDLDGSTMTGVDGNDDPWDFGTSMEYPVLQASSFSVARQRRGAPMPTALVVTLTGPVSLAEGDTAEYTVRTPSALPYAVTAHWSVVATTETGMAAGADFGDGARMQLARFPTGTAVIPRGGSSATFSVHIFDDGEAEPAERFSVRVVRVEGVTDAGARLVLSAASSPVVVVAIEFSDGRNYNRDGDRLIDVATADQLEAVGFDLDGDGIPAPARATLYSAAFPFFDAAQTCPSTCTGYELSNDIDLSGRNWEPIGWRRTPFGITSPPADIRYEGTFDGNGYVIRNLRVPDPDEDSDDEFLGLFSALGMDGVIRNVGLVSVDVLGSRDESFVGSLAGYNLGKIAASYAVGSGTVRGGFDVGGLVGENRGEIIACYVGVTVRPLDRRVGGLVGRMGSGGTIIASYASGRVHPRGQVNPRPFTGGLVGEVQSGGRITNSYSSRELSGLPGSGGTTPPGSLEKAWELYTPTSAAGIFAEWDNLNVDDTTGTVMGVMTLNDDAPWDFGNAFQYPVLRHGRSATAVQAAVQAQQSSQTLHLRPTLRGDAVVSEGGTARYVVSLEQALPPSGLPSGVAASWSWSAGGGAVRGGDFDGTTGGRVVIAPGAVSASFSLATAADDAAEVDEAFTVSLSDAALSGDVGSTSLGVASAVRTTIAANQLGQVTIVAASETVAEGATATFTLRLDGGDGGDVAVRFEVVSASASTTPADLESVTWSDRAGSTSVQVSAFPIAGSVTLSTAGTATVSVRVAADAVPGESGERFGVRLTRCDLCGNPRPVEIGVPSAAQVTISRTPLTVLAHVYLEGAYISETSGMKTTLAGLLPASQPYGVAPWNYLADTSVPPVAGRLGLSGVTSTVVDWVLVELRASAPGAGADAALPTTDGVAAGLLLSDGRIAGIGAGALALDGVPVAPGFAQGSEIYVVIHHRNHLPVMSAQPVAFGAAGCDGYCADFRNVPSYQGCAQSQRAGGVYTMVAGDVNRSSVVSWGDDGLLLRENYSVDADLDFSGALSPADARLILANHLLASECTPRRPRP